MEYLLNGYENFTQHTKDFTLTNTFGLTEFGSVMKKLLCFYLKHVF
jgi:hypothetical protein